ncbi:MAG: carbon starvation CstA family protein [Eubacteriaceae bacterium]
MRAVLILAISILILLAGYTFYGKWLCKVWGIDSKRKTPSEIYRDEIDYIPTDTRVLFGHHFASIAGAGPINGPIQAAIFGWAPVVLWIVLGGIFFGAVQDVSSLLASVRNYGKSLAYISEKSIGRYAKQLFYVFALFALLFLNASFIDMVASSYNGFNSNGIKVLENASSGTASIMFVFMSLIFGFAFHRNKNNGNFLLLIIGAVFIFICIAMGISFPVYLNKNTWMIIIIAYIFAASITPVWILLQPRDFLNSCLLYAIFIIAAAGIIFLNPQMHLPAFNGFNAAGDSLFPMLFITVSCGAISGFHSLVCSGTTSKQIKSEADIKILAFGGMVVECVIAVIAIIVAGCVFNQSTMYKSAPFIIFSQAMASLFAKAGLNTNTIYIITMLTISAFALTTLDTTTRLARYLIQEFSSDIKSETIKKRISNQYIATALTVAITGILAFGGFKNIWSLFGTVNQLLAAIALLTVSVWLGSKGKKIFILIIPMAFMLIAAITSLILLLYNNIVKLVGGMGTFIREGIQTFLIVLLIYFAIKLTANCFKALLDYRSKKKKIERKYNR